MKLAWLCAPLLLTGCGYVGDPLPPALHIPEPVRDLAAIQRGANLELTFTLPGLTTEGLGLEKPGEIELRVGPPQQSGFEVNAWAATARLVKVTPPEEGAAVRATAPLTGAPGTEIFAAVRTTGPRGRWSAWSNVVVIPMQRPLRRPTPTANSAPGGVRLQWTGDAPIYRITRLDETAKEPTMISEAPGNTFTDINVEMGKRYRYQVTGVVKAGDVEALSDASTLVEIIPEDRFPPAVPQGLTALSGVSTIELSWERNTEPDIKAYVVYRAAGEGPFEKLADHEPPSYSDRAVESGKSYRYAVAAVDAGGNESPRSQPVTIQLP